ncbi:spermine synthase [Bathymodiolus japonicus methanotrophic gill symbiont]|uniref:spermine/spermidine synthase domain-containing protein n=1 Tax=Bathymodiolus japonicus methanotrophic gill symbiont TaxID=113269 RepID=UPI001E625264|nr:spermine synthase [Bathymodiolus japonicus methanotrophic gill symbiont]
MHQEVDEQGLIEIVETEGVRALHFGTDPRQSSMLLSAPNELHSKYVRAMMVWLLFKQQPDSVLMVGVGGGSLSKYLLYHFPQCQIKAVELRQAIIKIAQRFFALPLDPRLKVKISEGARYIKRQSENQSELHDLIIIDAFNEVDMADTMQGINLFSACKQLLTDEGLLVINLWGTSKELFKQISWEMDVVFQGKVLFLPVRGRGNIIAIAFAGGGDQYSMRALKLRARLLEEQYQIEYIDFLKDLKRNNSKELKRVIKA